MDDKSQFSSRALEVNLAATSTSQIRLPEQHEWFLGLSESHFGIHERTAQFLHEFNHPYRNYSWLADKLKVICLGDIWFYASKDESEKAFETVVSFFKDLLFSKADQRWKESFLQALIQFLEQIMSGSRDLSHISMLILNLIDQVFLEDPFLVISSSGYIKHLSPPSRGKEKKAVFTLTRKILISNIEYWKSTTSRKNIHSNRLLQTDNLHFPEAKLTNITGSHVFSDITEQIQKAETLEELTALPFFGDITGKLRDSAELFENAIERIYYIIYLLQLPGMTRIKDHLLWDINRLLSTAFVALDDHSRDEFIDTFFQLSGNLGQHHMSTILGCIETLGQSVINIDNKTMIDKFVENLICFGFVNPSQIRIREEWQLETNPNHLKNIRVWLHLIEMNPPKMKELLAALVIHLRIGGIFIQDTDLFQKDITQLLNSDIGSLYKLTRHLSVLFPVYFSEIGAEGELRDSTTRIDELSSRGDLLIHFLRKQIHVESNNTHIKLALNILHYWHTLDTEPLLPFLPPDVTAFLETSGQWIDGVHEVTGEVCRIAGMTPAEIVSSGMDINDDFFPDNPHDHTHAQNIERVKILFRLARLLREKYSVDTENILPVLKGHEFIRMSEIAQLEENLEENDYDSSLSTIFSLMDSLKAVILDPEPSTGWENIYYKRHIAAGIPSMYGKYHERKFEALGLTYRLETVASRLIETIIASINLDYVTIKKLKRIVVILKYFEKGLELRGIVNTSFQSNIQMLSYSLRSGSFSLEQYINIFSFFIKDIRNIINRYFISVYDRPLRKILQLHYSTEPENENSFSTVTKKKETFYRELFASAFLVQILDSFVAKILDALKRMKNTFPKQKLHEMMSYDPDILMSFLHGGDLGTDNKVFLGAKAYYLKKLANLGYPVPAGFVLSTELFRNRYFIMKHPSMESEVYAMISKGLHQLELRTGLKFGDPDNALLLSVRSGTAFSMPGAMTTFLNVGMNREIAEGMGRHKKYAWAAWDCYRRLLQSWGMSFGLSRDIFDQLMNDMKKQSGVEWKKSFSPIQMKTLANRYHDVLSENGISFEENLEKQLKIAIFAVLDSWSTKRAKVYRQHLQIADEWGTAVTIQQMVLGNLNESSGTGVLFTHDTQDKSDSINLNGDYILRSQGEDVVAGLVHPLPLSRNQKTADTLKGTKLSLQDRFPVVFDTLLMYARRMMEEHGFPHQEIEFTFESSSNVFILQARPQHVSKQEHTKVFHFENSVPVPAGSGIGIGGGAMNGIVVFDLEDIKTLSATLPGEKTILLRPDTVPDDIEMVFACDGLLTSRGGITSHAAVTASQLGKVCVVNCRDLMVNEKDKIAHLNDLELISGSRIAIDGNTGNIYEGNYPVLDSVEQDND